MKKMATLGAALLAAAFTANVAHAASADTKTVDVSATISGVSALNVEVRKITDDTVATAIGFGSVANTVAPWSTLPGEYVKISVDDNETSWALKIYTENFGGVLPDTTTWGWQYGGMIAPARDGAKVALGWLANPTTIASPGPGTGDPALGRALDAGGNWIAGGNGFTYVKDSADGDTPTQTGDQSFDITSGYLNVAFGSFSETRIVRPNLETATELLASPTAPFYLYVEGQFNGAPPAAYSTTIKFDLINQ